MTPQSMARLGVGEKIASLYASHPDVRTVFAFGSAGNGFSDDYSDLELGIIWQCPPEPVTLQTIAAEAGGTNWVYQGVHEQKLSIGDTYNVAGLKIDPAHWGEDTIDRIINDVIVHHDVSKNMLMYERQATAATLMRCIPLVGHEYLESLRDKLVNYPRALAVRMIEANMTFRSLDEIRMLSERAEVPLLQEHMCGRIRQMYALIFALNSLYFPSFKWTRLFLRNVQIIPSNFEIRIDKLLTSASSNIVIQYQSLVTELFGLISTHFPEVNVSEAVSTFNKPVPQWRLPSRD